MKNLTSLVLATKTVGKFIRQQTEKQQPYLHNRFD